MLIEAFIIMLNQSFYTDMDTGCLDLHSPARSPGGIVSAAPIELQHPAWVLRPLGVSFLNRFVMKNE